EFENFPSDDELRDATMVNQAIEEQVLQSPEQYLWAHRRFKTRPEGEKDVYAT
ncbi:MAG: lipid A biosynthesis acyltransferase, partial [Thiohalomonadales bacterium]